MPATGRLQFCAIAALLFTTAPAFAQEVVLKGIDSPLDIRGELLSAEGGKFVVKTAIGEFEIEQALVTCEGEACPQVRELTYEFNLVGDEAVAETLIPILAEGFAATLDAETQLLDTNGNPIDQEAAEVNLEESGKIALGLVDYDGEELANLGLIDAEGMDAYSLLVSGEAPVMFSDARASRKERDFVKDGGAGDLTAFEQDHVIAVEGFTVVVHPKNALGPVTLQQVADVFAGKITDWQQLGGTAGQINVYSFDTESETFATISELVLEPFDYTLSPEADIVRNAGELTTVITQDEAGFGIVNYSARRETRALPVTNECNLTFYISPFNIKTEEYPLSHRVHMYNRPDLEGMASEFRDYIGGPDLDGLVSKAGYIDLSVVAEPQIEAAERTTTAAAATTDTYELGYMQRLAEMQGQFERLSTTFRFAPGSDELDSKSKRDLTRMLAYLADRKPSEVVAVGFTDDKGGFDANLLVAEQNAAKVLNEITQQATGGELDGIAFSALGFGELSPVACNTSPRGRAINRRVELWIK